MPLTTHQALSTFVLKAARISIFLGLNYMAVPGCRTLNFRPSANEELIAGGQSVSESDSEYLSTVALVRTIQVDDAIKHQPFCSGTLISPTVVLTAAHCVIGSQYPLIFVSFALDARETKPDDALSRSVQSIIAHPDYVPNDPVPYGPSYHGSDLALLKLTAKAPEGAKPVPIEQGDISQSAGLDVTLAGYGYTSFTEEADSGDIGVLRKVLAQTQDSAKWQSESGVLLYSGPNGLGACAGDSGGPMYRDNEGARYVVGITKGGGSCGQSESSNDGLYTSLFPYRNWITCSSGIGSSAESESEWKPFGCNPKPQVCRKMKVSGEMTARVYLPGRSGVRFRETRTLPAESKVTVESWMGSWIRFNDLGGPGFAELRSFQPDADESCTPIPEGAEVQIQTKTVLKAYPVDSSELQSNQKCTIPAPTTVRASVVRQLLEPENHVMVTLAEPIKDCDIGSPAFLFRQHIVLPDAGLLIP